MSSNTLFKNLSADPVEFSELAAEFITVADPKQEMADKAQALIDNADDVFSVQYVNEYGRLVTTGHDAIANDRDRDVVSSLTAQFQPGTVRDNSADMFWAGAKYKPYTQTRKQENFKDCFDIGYDSEQLVMVSDDRFGNRIVRFWLTRESNVTARIRYERNNVCYLIELFHNVKTGTRWNGTKVTEYRVHRTITDAAELTVSKLVAVEFAKAQANA